MATYDVRETQTTVLEIAVPLPAYAGDLGRAISGMHQALKARGLPLDSDDCYRIEADDEHLLLRADVDSVTAPADIDPGSTT